MGLRRGFMQAGAQNLLMTLSSTCVCENALDDTPANTKKSSMVKINVLILTPGALSVRFQLG